MAAAIRMCLRVWELIDGSGSSSVFQAAFEIELQAGNPDAKLALLLPLHAPHQVAFGVEPALGRHRSGAAVEGSLARNEQGKGAVASHKAPWSRQCDEP